MLATRTPASSGAMANHAMANSAMSNGSVSQAQSLTTSNRQSPAGANGPGAPTLLVASGRGGSGTTLIASLLAVAAAGDGHRVLFIDADDVVGPASMLLGVRGAPTWQELRSSQRSAADVITPVSETLSIVAGGVAAGTDAIAVNPTERRACMRRLLSVTSGFDLVVIDCGSRLDALTASLTPHAGERLLAITAGSDPVTLASTYALVKAARLRHASLSVEMIVNRQDDADAQRSFDALDAGARQFLGISLTLAGIVSYDRTLDTALRAGMSFWDAAAGSPAAIAAHDVAARIMSPLSLSLSRSGL